jgi:polyisoprenyl-phosphate glycosyltransferase
MRENRTRLLVICPVFNEEKNIEYFFGRIQAVFAAVDQSRYACSLLFTNNRSSDRTLELIQALGQQHSWVNHLTLSRNFGYQLSILSGLSTGDADLYMTCDVDCEDPPELLHTFLEGIESGRDLVYGIRNNRQDSWLMARCRHGFYSVLRALGDYKIVPYMAEFAMVRRHVRDQLVANVNTFPFIRAEVGYVGFDILGIPYRREERVHGETHYNYSQNFRFAVAGILSSTTFPLRAALYSFPMVLGVIIVMCGSYLSGLLSFETALLVIVSLAAAYSVSALAFISVYLARTYQNGLRRSRFIIDRRLSHLPAHAARTNEPYAEATANPPTAIKSA